METKKIGAFVGKFLPPHIGHLSIIDKALTECDEVIVVLSDNPKKSKELCKNANFPYFSAKKRLKWIKNHYKTHKNIKFYVINEGKLNPYTNQGFASLFWKTVKEPVNYKYADESYRELNEKYFPECKFVPIDRDAIPVHGTDIRNKDKTLDYVISEGKADILKKLNKNK